MVVKKHTKDSIILTLQNFAKRLGKDTLTKQEVASVISLSTVNYYFGNLSSALSEVGLKTTQHGANLKNRPPVYSDEELFLSILAVEQTIGLEPGFNAYSVRGKYSVKPFRARFGTWGVVLTYYRKWKEENQIGQTENRINLTKSASNPTTLTPITTLNNSKRPLKLYGEPIDFRGLHHAPINEQGVVFLFGMVSKELGFRIESIQTGFPDCSGKYLYDSKKNLWADAKIELEFKASNFKDHGHAIDQCDFIVCWENNWPDCPLRVIELRSEILKLPAK